MQRLNVDQKGVGILGQNISSDALERFNRRRVEMRLHDLIIERVHLTMRKGIRQQALWAYLAVAEQRGHNHEFDAIFGLLLVTAQIPVLHSLDQILGRVGESTLTHLGTASHAVNGAEHSVVSHRLRREDVGLLEDALQVLVVSLAVSQNDLLRIEIQQQVGVIFS